MNGRTFHLESGTTVTVAHDGAQRATLSIGATGTKLTLDELGDVMTEMEKIGAHVDGRRHIPARDIVSRHSDGVGMPVKKDVLRSDYGKPASTPSRPAMPPPAPIEPPDYRED